MVPAAAPTYFSLQCDFARLEGHAKQNAQIEKFQTGALTRLQNIMNAFFQRGFGIHGLVDTPNAADVWNVLSPLVQMCESQKSIVDEYLTILEFCVKHQDWELVSAFTNFQVDE